MYAHIVSNMYISSLYEELEDLARHISQTHSELKNKKATGEMAIPLDIYPDIPYCNVDNYHSYVDIYGNSRYATVSRSDIVKFRIPKHLLLDTLCSLTDNLFESKLYGIIAVSNNIRINPYHPVIAYDIIKNYDDYMRRFDEHIEIILYRYNNKATTDHNVLLESIESIGDIIELVKNHSYETSVGYDLHNFNTYHTLCDHIRSQEANFGSINITPKNFTAHIDSVLVPVQFLVSGIIFPYYGIVHSKKEDEEHPYKSIDLSPFRSGNINSPVSEYRYVDTCTGSHSNMLYDSLMTLNYMNGSSTYYTDIITDGYKEFAHASMLYSSQLYKNFINQRTNHVEK